MSEGFRFDGRNWTDKFGNIAKFPDAISDPFELRGNAFVATRALVHAGRKFRKGALLGRIERDRNGQPQLVEHDGRVSKLNQ